MEVITNKKFLFYELKEKKKNRQNSNLSKNILPCVSEEVILNLLRRKPQEIKVRTVSYTHLDVYKRQTIYFLNKF